MSPWEIAWTLFVLAVGYVLGWFHGHKAAREEKSR